MRIEHLVKLSHQKLEHSKALYVEAESLLLDELGLKDWQPSEANVAVKSFAESFGSTGRLDAEYYQPKYQELETQIRTRGATNIAELCDEVQRGVQPEFVEGGSVFVVASKAVRPTSVLLDEQECTDEHFYNRRNVSKARLKQGDVLLNGTGRGTLGRASIYDYDFPAIADNHVTILRTKQDACDPYYLMVFLNSIAGQMQSEKFQSGTSGQLELYPNQIEQFVIYAPSKTSTEGGLQERVGSLIRQSFSLRRESQVLLDIAKRGVEMAIEEDERAALAWMEKETESVSRA